MSTLGKLDSPPYVSVIVPVYNDRLLVSVLLHALAAQDYPCDRFECIFVDNGSDEPLELGEVPGGLSVRLLREDRPGSYAARNRGLREARGQVLAFTDADCIPHKEWLSAAVACIGSTDGDTMVGGRIDVFSPYEAPASAIVWHSILNDLNQELYVLRRHFAATANMVTTREVFHRVGDFDPEFFSGGDFDWGKRAWSLGVKQLYAEHCVVAHPARATWSSMMKRGRRIIGGHYALHRPTGRPFLGTLGMMLRSYTSATRRAWRDPRLSPLSMRLRVIAVDGALRASQFCEIVRLRLGGRPRRQ